MKIDYLALSIEAVLLALSKFHACQHLLEKRSKAGLKSPKFMFGGFWFTFGSAVTSTSLLQDLHDHAYLHIAIVPALAATYILTLHSKAGVNIVCVPRHDYPIKVHWEFIFISTEITYFLRVKFSLTFSITV